MTLNNPTTQSPLTRIINSLHKRPCNLLVILGPTASGKTRLAVELAKAVDGEIISADSRQVYRGMDIGTGKDLHEYGSVSYHLIDILPPGDEFNLYEFQRRFLECFQEVRTRGKLPILAGGSGMYLDCVLRGYRLCEVPEDPDLRAELSGLPQEILAERLVRANPKQHNTTDLLERDRLIRAIEIAEHSGEIEPWPEIAPLVVGIRWERSKLRERITVRLRDRLQSGMIEEARRLHDQGVSWEKMEFYGLEYRYLARHLKGELNRNDMFQKLNSAIHDFAKKQENWFRKMESRGTDIIWVEGKDL